MAHSNIYIRKENELSWNSIPDKSAWINERLEKWHPLMGTAETSKGKAVKIPQVIKAPKPEVTGSINPASELECPRHHVPYKLCEDKH